MLHGTGKRPFEERAASKRNAANNNVDVNVSLIIGVVGVAGLIAFSILGAFLYPNHVC